jgi:hypothetical protein
VQLEQVDPLQAQAPEAALARRAEPFGPSVGFPLVRAITSPEGYGCSASAMSSSLTCGPYESAVSIKVTPSSTARRRTATAPSGSDGGPQIPRPVIRIAPNPIRSTVRSPPRLSVPAPVPISPRLEVEQLELFEQ